ncbi:hypothetical protein SJI00_16460 [Pseudomonas sp. RP23018S]|uniref:hypothetical protein n=1 Tax=Pseudomonas sp. RP23018S TaxID=3096037 RepID=UPI002ACA539E|nr:hypothetical protein [Pseudomonas sp. RP23018S]MDZ5604365.1 hypothetical protein [Pseudomonas sp. RP23018S]
MKGTALSALFAAATLLASPVFAAEDLCAGNLQKIDDTLATMTTAPEGQKMAIGKQVDEAKMAESNGDKEKCVTISTKVLSELNKTEKGSGSASGSGGGA